METTEHEKQENGNYLKYIFITGSLLLIGLILWFVFRKNNNSVPQMNLGEQQRQQVRELSSQLVGSILDNQNNFNQLTNSPNGTRRGIEDIEELFLLSALSNSPQSISQITSINNGVPPEVIEQAWYELRPFIIAALQNSNQTILENIRSKIINDIEKWLKWELEKKQEDYNKLLEEYLNLVKELKTIKELFEKYSQIRNNLVISKVSRKDELIKKGYSEQDIEQLRSWNLLEQDFPNLFDEKRVGVTNTLSVMYRDNGWGEEQLVGGSSSELLLFLKPNNSSNLETSINFPSNKVSDSQQKSVREIIYNLLKNSSKLGEEIKKYDVYILRLRTGNTKYTGSSSGVAHYLALYSALHKIPLPRNLASTATVEGKRVGKIGGLKYKIEAVINKSNPIDTFILSEDNRKDKNCPEQSYEDIPLHITSKIKQAHFISQVDQIETALQEIIREPNRKIVHSCEKNEVPRKEEPEKKPSFPIGSEQLLSLITELRIREKGNLGDQKDFWEKLKKACTESKNYQEAINETLKLHEEYLKKIENNSSPDDEGLQKKIAGIEKQIREKTKMLEEKLNPEREQQLRIEIGLLEKQLIQLREGKKSNQNRTELEKEYQNKFQKIASSVANLTTEILISLQNLGYIIQEIKWTGELKAPSLTAEPSVSFFLKVNE